MKCLSAYQKYILALPTDFPCFVFNMDDFARFDVKSSCCSDTDNVRIISHISKYDAP